jgi:hypothetical protein
MHATVSAVLERELRSRDFLDEVALHIAPAAEPVKEPGEAVTEPASEPVPGAPV